MSTFFPPPPFNAGGAQPWTGRVPLTFIEALQNVPPIHPGRSTAFQQMAAAWFAPPYQTAQQLPVRNIFFQVASVDPPPIGAPLIWLQQQTQAVLNWQPPLPLAQYKLALQRITGPTPPPPPIPPPPPPAIPGPFPHDEYDDDGYSFWRNTRRDAEAARLKRMRQEIGLLPPDREEETEQIQELLDDPSVSIEFIVAQLSAHYYAKYQTALRQAQARADLARETARKRQDFYLSSAERAARTEQGRRLVLKKLIEEDDAKVMAMIEKLLN